MALRDEISPFIDGNLLVAPSLVSPGTLKASDNGPMYTAEYYVMLKKLDQIFTEDVLDFQSRIGNCINPQGMLNRTPIGQDDGQEGPDDYLGVLNGCVQFGNTDIPRRFLKAVFKYQGALNNESPGTWTIQSFLIRQPQLLAAIVAASFPSWKNPLHILIRILSIPFFIYAAGCIAVAGLGDDHNDTDSRRLSWHLMQIMKPVSLLGWIASTIWLRRLYKDYGPTGMQAVASIYYQPGHPFAKYWVTE